jgi:hypothetical protein
VAALAADRDLLWGQAMAVHLTGESIMLPESLWADAGAEQDKRTAREAWIDDVANVSASARLYMTNEHGARDHEDIALGVVYQNTDLDDGGQRERVSSAFVLAKVIGIPSSQRTPEHSKRLGVAMRANGWKGPDSYWLGGRTVNGYERELAPS